MKSQILYVLCLAANLPLLAQDLKAYQIFDREGKYVDFEHLVESAAGSEVVLFGELHNKPISRPPFILSANLVPLVLFRYTNQLRYL